MNLRAADGAGSILGLGMFLSLIMLGGLSFTAAEAVVQQTRLQALADTLAVASSDALQGLNAGLPCESAEDLAQEGEVNLLQCSIVGQSVHISLGLKSLGIVLSAEAIAEPMQ